MNTSTSLPEDSASPGRNQRRLLLLAWASTLLPLIAFGYLTWQSYEMGRQVDRARTELGDLEQQKASLEQQKAALEKDLVQIQAKLEQQRDSTKHYRDFAGIRIQFYRESDRTTVEKALENLGFRVDTTLGASRLINTSPNTIAYGALVSVQDLQDIAVALVRAKFPLKRVTKAMVQPDPKLIQIFASAASDRECGLLTEDLIRQGQVCGPR
jgi:chaperonin cofactor prefoldin